MANFHLITVGKLRDSGLKNVEDGYLKRLKTLNLKIHELKSKSEDVNAEADLVLKRISVLAKDRNYKIITLEEKGAEYDSPTFSDFVRKLNETTENIFFVLGGSAGHGESILKNKTTSFSLGKLTYPHQLARIIFVEQFYRAQTIIDNHPYHK